MKFAPLTCALAFVAALTGSMSVGSAVEEYTVPMAVQLLIVVVLLAFPVAGAVVTLRTHQPSVMRGIFVGGELAILIGVSLFIVYSVVARTASVLSVVGLVALAGGVLATILAGLGLAVRYVGD